MSLPFSDRSRAMASASMASASTAMAPSSVEGCAQAHQADPAQRRRLRWRARRGLLENDLVLTRFLDRHELELGDDEVAGLDLLLDLTDNELLDLILARKELEDDAAMAGARAVLERLRQA